MYTILGRDYLSYCSPFQVSLFVVIGHFFRDLRYEEEDVQESEASRRE
jgi:hypothetical protein